MDNETIIRLGVFVVLFAIFAGAEALAPRRPRNCHRSRRWLTNLSITVLNTVMLRALAIGFPLLAVGAAIDASQNGMGLFNNLNWPGWFEVILCVLILDFAIWLQHLITHKVPILWRLHRVHHADRDMDVTTAIRFHPIEIALSMILKIGLIYVLGPSALAVVLFEILLNGTAFSIIPT